MSTVPRRRAAGQSKNSFPAKPANLKPRVVRGRGKSGAAIRWIAALAIAPVVSFALTVYAPAGAHAMRSYAAPLLHRITQRATALPMASKPLVSILSPPAPAPVLPAGSVSLTNPNAPITVQTFREVGVPFTMVIGGEPGSYRAPVRQAVGEMVEQTKATAGLNGTFFANASLTGTDNLLIGPSLCGNDPGGKLLASPYDVKPQLAGRPMVLLAPGNTAIVPYDKAVTRSAATLRAFQPGLTDAFLGGVWLVRNGAAADTETVGSFHVGDAMDPRRRAFFAVMPDGRPALGATTYVASSAQLAAALAAAGVQDAVLLDSGFSTSLVFQSKVLVTGHTAPGIPSRPVPQALLLFGSPTAHSVQLAESLTTSVGRDYIASAPQRRRSARRGRRMA